ncbi:hypothetical protein AB1Y20_017776 [Prymnesium parvum]|uniref:Uncharacterized protein n=1 Tax=Prymnesium parvum TaxID=97485 RepID=A0AB34JPD6_PRYPA
MRVASPSKLGSRLLSSHSPLPPTLVPSSSSRTEAWEWMVVGNVPGRLKPRPPPSSTRSSEDAISHHLSQVYERSRQLHQELSIPALSEVDDRWRLLAMLKDIQGLQDGTDNPSFAELSFPRLVDSH